MIKHNKLREYKGEIYRLQKDLKDHKEQALATRNEYANWNKKLQDKIKDFRAEKSSWQTEATEMRAAHKELKVRFTDMDVYPADNSILPRQASPHRAGYCQMRIVVYLCWRRKSRRMRIRWTDYMTMRSRLSS